MVTPTRELAAQIGAMLSKLAAFTDVSHALVVGGVPLRPQELELRRRPDVVVCTPGRMLDHCRNSVGVALESVRGLMASVRVRVTVNSGSVALESVRRGLMVSVRVRVTVNSLGFALESVRGLRTERRARGMTD